MERIVGLKAPDFKMTAISGYGSKELTVSLKDYSRKWLVLFFYPLDFTFVWPTEIRAFSERYDEIKECGAEVLGVSIDSHFTHGAWIKNGLGELKFPLASDLTHEVSKNYGVYIEDFGAAQRGIFIIDDESIIRYVSISDLGAGRDVDAVVNILKAAQQAKAGKLVPANWKEGNSFLN